MRTKAFILKKQNINEYDQLITCYTEEFGKAKAVAKSILKPSSIQAMHLDLFNFVDFELINGRAIPIISGAQAEEVYGGIKRDLGRLAVAYFFAEVIDKTAFDYQKDRELWNFLSSLLTDLNVEQIELKSFFRDKQVELLDILGYFPNFSECSFCRTNVAGTAVAYSSETKGVICGDCFLSGRQGIVVKNGEFLSSTVLNSVFESILERKINSISFIKTLLG